jgi:hypothetical protein
MVELAVALSGSLIGARNIARGVRMPEAELTEVWVITRYIIPSIWVPGRPARNQLGSSHARHRALTRVIWCGVRQDTRMRSGLATMMAIALAREVATFSRCRS